MARLLVCRAGVLEYRAAWDLQRAVAARIAAGLSPDTLLLLEHPPTYTCGPLAGPRHLLVPEAELRRRGAVLIATDRGGDFTYHGPGQVVGYPLLNLRRRGGDLHCYLAALETALIRAVARWGVAAQREPGLPGIWVGNEKLAAIGIKISRGVSLHGFALNVNTDLAWFDLIVPCGLRERGVTSLQRLTGRPVPLEQVLDALEEAFGAVFGTQTERVSLDTLRAAAAPVPAPVA